MEFAYVIKNVLQITNETIKTFHCRWQLSALWLNCPVTRLPALNGQVRRIKTTIDWFHISLLKMESKQLRLGFPRRIKYDCGFVREASSESSGKKSVSRLTLIRIIKIK